MELTLEQRRNRMAHLKDVADANRAFGRKMYIHDYLPGHAVYTMEMATDAAAFDRLKALRAAGVDVLRIPVQEYETETSKKFTDLCHYFGLRVIFTTTNWNGAPGARWRSEVLPKLLKTMDACGFDGICADMRRWDYAADTAHDPELEDMLWQLYTHVRSRGGILVLCCGDNFQPPCIDKVYDYLLTDGVCADLHISGFAVPETADFAQTVPFLQLPVLTGENSGQWAHYRRLCAPMTKENTLVYLDLKESADILSALPENVHVSMFVNDVKYMAVSNLSDKPVVLNLRGTWTDRVAETSSSAFTVNPAQLLLLKQN